MENNLKWNLKGFSNLILSLNEVTGFSECDESSAFLKIFKLK
jgi:hypothetical protein